MISEVVIKWAIPFVLSAIVGMIVKYLKDFSKREKIHHNIMLESLVVIIRNDIVNKASTYIDLGFIPNYARLSIEEMFKKYQELGGNHGVETLVEQCFQLPPAKIKIVE